MSIKYSSKYYFKIELAPIFLPQMNNYKNTESIEYWLQGAATHMHTHFLQWTWFEIIHSEHTVSNVKPIAKSRANFDQGLSDTKTKIFFEVHHWTLKDQCYLTGHGHLSPFCQVESEFAINFAFDIAIQTVWKQCKLYNNGTLFESAQKRQVRLFS